MPDIFNFELHNWRQIDGQLDSISAGVDLKNVWGVNRQNQVFRFDPGQSGGKFDFVTDSPLRKISVGGAEVWGLDAKGIAYRYRKNSGKFIEIGGPFDYISAVLQTGHLWARAGNKISKFNFDDEVFEEKAEGFGFLGVGQFPTDIWVLNDRGIPLKWHEDRDFARTSNEFLPMKYIAPTFGQAVALSFSSSTYLSSRGRFEGGYIPGVLQSVSTGLFDVSAFGTGGSTDQVWGLNAGGAAYRLEGQGWVFQGSRFSKLKAGSGATEVDENGFETGNLNVWSLGI
jgi:hypothetical protein